MIIEFSRDAIKRKKVCQSICTNSRCLSPRICDISLVEISNDDYGYSLLLFVSSSSLSLSLSANFVKTTDPARSGAEINERPS